MTNQGIPDNLRHLYEDQTSRHGDGTLLKDEKTIVQESKPHEQAKAAKDIFDASMKQQAKDAEEADKKAPAHRKEPKTK